jgi:hypothetical protein
MDNSDTVMIDANTGMCAVSPERHHLMILVNRNKRSDCLAYRPGHNSDA